MSISPIKFSSPLIHLCELQKKRILFNGISIERQCLVPSIGSTSSSSSSVSLVIARYEYAFESIPFKESLFGSVFRGWKLEEDENGNLIQLKESYQIAVKVFIKQKMSQFADSAADDPIQEFSALQYIGDSHPNLLGQIECLEDSSCYYSIMRYCSGGELFKRVMSNGPLVEDLSRHIFIQLLSGLEYLQSKGIFHRDISLENILLSDEDETLTPYLIDYGMCLRIPDIITPSNCSTTKHLLPSMRARGKKSYMAPEIVSEHPTNGYSSDVWSLGIVLFTLLSGKLLVTTASPLCQLFRYVRAGKFKEMCRKWRLDLSHEVEDLLFKMLVCNPADRITVEEMKRHPWVMGTLLLQSAPSC